MSREIRASARVNARWTAIAQAVRIGYQLAGLLLLSRLLEPDAFGLVAMATVVANFANLVRDLGTAAAIIQRKTLNPETISTAFWFSVATGFIIALVVCASSPLLARFFQRPELTFLLLLLALSFPLASLGSVHQALLERDSQFPVIARIEIIAGGVGLAVAVSAALAGAGAYSLVGQMVVVSALSMMQLWLASPWRPRGFMWNQREFREIWSFSGSLAGFNIINYFSRNADSIIIGRVLGAATLGTYSLAYRLMLFPVQNLTHVATRAFFPVLSQLREKPSEAGALYLRAVSAIAILAAPLMVGLFTLRELFVSVVLGDAWSGVGPLIAWLAPVGLIQSVSSTTGTVFMSTGRTGQLLRLGVFSAAVQLVALGIGVQRGIIGVAQLYLVASFITAIPAVWFANAALGIDQLKTLRAIGPPIGAAVAMGGFIELLDGFIPELFELKAAKLLILCVLGGFMYIGMLRMIFPAHFDVAVGLIRQRAH